MEECMLEYGREVLILEQKVSEEEKHRNA